MSTTIEQRYLGALLGLAAGDALGTTLEFTRPGRFEPIYDMIGGGPFRLRPGEWTDDTAMALCLAESLVECGGFDAGDQMERYLRWRDEGYMSATGQCFDIGTTVSSALERFAATLEPYSGSHSPDTAGNGSLMRLAPVPMRWRTDREALIANAARSSRTTHGAVEAVDACRFHALLIAGALSGDAKETLLDPGYAPVVALTASDGFAPAIREIALGAYRHRQPPEIRGTGYVVQSLEAALWALHNTDDFREGALLAVNLGEDADTTGAVYGQLAGALYGVQSIPQRWRSRLAMADRIEDLALALLADAE